MAINKKTSTGSGQPPESTPDDTGCSGIGLPDTSSLDLVEAITATRNAVDNLQNAAMDPFELLEALDRYDAAISAGLGKRVTSRRLGMSLPLTAADYEVSDLCIELYTELANGYKSALPNLGNGHHLRHAADQFIRAACGTITSLKHAILCAYETYRVEPSGIWRTIHRVYARSRQLNLNDVGASRLDQGGTKYVNITRSYKHVLLLALSNPYQLPFRIVHNVDDALREWADLAQLSPTPLPGNNRVLFLIEPAMDRPAVQLLSQQGLDQSNVHWILDTTNLAAEVRNEMKKLVENYGKNPSRLDSFASFAQLEMLRSLVGLWGSRRMRGSERKKTTTYCDVAIGMNSVTYAVNGLKSFEVYNDSAHFELGKNVIRGTFGRLQAEQSNVVHLSKSWQIADVSDKGFRLILTDPDRQHIQVNELIAIRPRDLSQGWLTGLVKWARCKEAGELEIGIRTISTEARPVSVRTFELSDDSIRSYSLGLFLPAAEDSDPMAIIPSGLYCPKRSLALRSAENEQIARVVRLIMSTRAFDWFAIQFEDDTHDKYKTKYGCVSP